MISLFTPTTGSTECLPLIQMDQTLKGPPPKISMDILSRQEENQKLNGPDLVQRRIQNLNLDFRERILFPGGSYLVLLSCVFPYILVYTQINQSYRKAEVAMQSDLDDITKLSHAIEIAHDFIKWRYLLLRGKFYLAANQYDLALEDFENCLPDIPTDVKQLVNELIAHTHYLKGSLETAFQLYQELSNYGPLDETTENFYRDQLDLIAEKILSGTFSLSTLEMIADSKSASKLTLQHIKLLWARNPIISIRLAVSYAKKKNDFSTYAECLYLLHQISSSDRQWDGCKKLDSFIVNTLFKLSTERIKKNNNDFEAQFILGYLYYNDNPNLNSKIPTNERKKIGLEHLLIAAKSGEPQHQWVVAGCLEKMKNFQDAFNYYLKAANQNYAQSFANLAYFYEYGLGMEKRNLEKALEYYKKAVTAGYPCNSSIERVEEKMIGKPEESDSKEEKILV